MNREEIYSALFERVKKAANFKTTSRKLRHWSDVTRNCQPALFQAQKSETAIQEGGAPAKWLLSVDVYVYVNTPGKEVPAVKLNPLIDAVVACFEADNVIKNKCTLGGLVEHAWVEGMVETDEGVLGDQAVAIIPVSILVT